MSKPGQSQQKSDFRVNELARDLLVPVLWFMPVPL